MKPKTSEDYQEESRIDGLAYRRLFEQGLENLSIHDVRKRKSYINWKKKYHDRRRAEFSEERMGQSQL